MRDKLAKYFRMVVPSAEGVRFDYLAVGKGRGWRVTYFYRAPDGNYIGRIRFLGQNSWQVMKRLSTAYGRMHGLRPSNTGAEASNV